MMGWFNKLKEGLKKTSSKISDSITSVVTKEKLDQETLDSLEDILVMADLGAETSAEVIKKISKSKFEKNISPEEVKTALAEIIVEILTPVAKKLTPTQDKPYTVLVLGVNGNGKTTTIGKLAQKFNQDGLKSTIAACDTYRAAAVEQLAVWAERAKAEFIQGEIESDPSSVAYRSVEAAKNNGSDILFIDTAGRLHNKTNLMDELKKMDRVIKKHGEQLPHENIIVIDATTGQNALNQVEEFGKIVNLTGIIITKLDGTAKAGIVVPIAKKFKLPIYAIGVGETIDDLNDFDPKEFANNLVGF
ncbi:MAG: signal recognition particle-docking protein FtsY [Rickettsiales bacterium]